MADTKGFGQADRALTEWAQALFQPEDATLREIRERAEREGLPPIAVGTFDGLLLEMLARATNARTAVEIGTLGGYSGVCLLRGLAPDGVLHTFELEEKHARVARTSFEKAGFAQRAHVHVGPALERLRDIEARAPFDLVFIDADKVSYPSYLAWAAEHLRVGGMVLGDNAFGWGGVAQAGFSGERRESVHALRTFNEQLARSSRFRATMIPTAEGLAMGIKIA